MEFISNIRTKIGRSLLKKKLGKVKRKVFYDNLKTVKNIGIIWDSSRVNEFFCLSRFYQKMHERNIEVKIIGYYPGKNLPDQYTAIRYLTCIRREEVSFFYQPESAETDAFIRNRFDILIDLNFQDLLPLKYISELSNAAFKVGLFNSGENENSFDLMMELRKPFEVETFLDQSLHYLEMINNKNNN
jgi:hypothetical protein